MGLLLMRHFIPNSWKLLYSMATSPAGIKVISHGDTEDTEFLGMAWYREGGGAGS
jgi:hypothetical protein